MTLLSTNGFPATATDTVKLATFVAAVNDTAGLAFDYNQSVSLRSNGRTIGTAGAWCFGVGAVPRSGTFISTQVNDYFPTHTATGSLM